MKINFINKEKLYPHSLLAKINQTKVYKENYFRRMSPNTRNKSDNKSTIRSYKKLHANE